jgi:hypothetical protein
VIRLTSEVSRVIASTWIGFMLTAILHTRVPLVEPGGVWIITSAAIWALFTFASPSPDKDTKHGK